MAVDGAIAERTRGILPVTWDMLSQDARYGESLLRTTIDTVKEEIFGVVTVPSLEATLPLIVIDYAAKRVALQLITPGIDAWRDSPIVVTTTGTNENTTYSDPVEALRLLRENLLAETKLAWPMVQPLIDFRRVSGARVPVLNTIDDELLTPSPQEFGRPYRVTDRS